MRQMTKEEASQHYLIPMDILDEYESWGLCSTVKQVMGQWQYDDQDLERLSTIMALHDMGFSAQEVEGYMRLLLSGTDTTQERIRMLEKRRDAALNEIHLKEKQLQRLDYLTCSFPLFPDKSWEKICTSFIVTESLWTDKF